MKIRMPLCEIVIARRGAEWDKIFVVFRRPKIWVRCLSNTTNRFTAWPALRKRYAEIDAVLLQVLDC